MPRVISWFSCGAASAYATYLAAKKYDDLEIIYCRVRQEHESNMEFLREFERKTNLHIKIIENEQFAGDIFNIFRKRKFIKSPKGAPCTMILKKDMRKKYQRPDDIQIFGFPVEESERAYDLLDSEPNLKIDHILIDAEITKADCKQWLLDRGFELPLMYQLGYANNNCVGCVKGGMGYWNAIRVDFPEAFNKMALLEREIGHSVCKQSYLDELDPNRGDFKRDMPSACGFLCEYQNPLFKE
jgi:3'-phosphoadenosine 5'-phosphosulfate sulfotransferase (PAPS reductase)/FAD synthetase